MSRRSYSPHGGRTEKAAARSRDLFLSGSMGKRLLVKPALGGGLVNHGVTPGRSARGRRRRLGRGPANVGPRPFPEIRTGVRNRASHRWRLWPLSKNEWVEMGDPAPPHRRTHGGTGAGVLALVKPLPPKAVAAGQALQGPSVPGYDRHRRTDGLRFKTMGSRQASCRALHHPFEIQ
jgi:hypothetical protein